MLMTTVDCTKTFVLAILWMHKEFVWNSMWKNCKGKIWNISLIHKKFRVSKIVRFYLSQFLFNYYVMLDFYFSINNANALKFDKYYRYFHIRWENTIVQKMYPNIDNTLFHYVEQEHPQMSENLVEIRSMHDPRIL